LDKVDLIDVTRLILKTRNSSLAKEKTITPDYAFLSEDAAQYLVDKGIKLVGTDNFSIDEFHNNNQPAHHILLTAGVVIIEGLDLTGINPADYELLCLPLKIENADGAPARVFLKELNE
jgi:arylformamidase